MPIKVISRYKTLSVVFLKIAGEAMALEGSILKGVEIRKECRELPENICEFHHALVANLFIPLLYSHKGPLLYMNC